MTKRVLSLISAGLLATTAFAQDSISSVDRRTLTAAADSALAAGDFAAAIDALEQLVTDTTSASSRDLYNLGVARYRRGDFEAAAEAFADVQDRLAPNELRAAAAYNKGTAIYQHVMETLDLPPDEMDGVGNGIEGIESAVESLQSGLEEYRRSLSIDPSDADAAANAQMTWEAIDQLQALKEQLEQQQQDQEQQDQEQPSQQQDQQQQQQGDSAQSSPPQEDEHDEQDGEAANADDAGDVGPSQQQQDIESLLDRARKAQGQIQEHLQTDPDDEQAQTQLEAIEEAIEQLESMQEDVGEQEEGTGQDRADRPSLEDLDSDDESAPPTESAGFGDDQEMSQEEARRLLQGVRDREQARRSDRAQRRRSGQQPVERDW